MKPPSIFGRRKPTPFDPLHKNKLKPVTKRTVANPALEFALQADMITKDEYQACVLSDMEVKNGRLRNWNYDHPTIPTGTDCLLFMGRGTEIMVGRLLGYDE